MKNTLIEWAEHTWNPVSGCDKISAGCENCYAEKIATFHKGPAFPRGFDITLRPHKLTEPLKTKEPTSFFVNSMSDLWHEGIPLEFVEQIFDVIAKCPQHVFMVLTKRPGRMVTVIEHLRLKNHRFATLPQLWLGVSVEDFNARGRLGPLRKMPDWGGRRFASFEPLIGPIPPEGNFDYIATEGLDWAILGGESGPGSRPMSISWLERLMADCEITKTACFVKQLGTVWAREVKGRHPKGGKPEEWPEHLRRREIPAPVVPRA